MDEEAVPDSEGEDYLPPVPNRTPPTPAPAPPSDAISSFPVKPVASTKETIASSSSVAPPTRPRPKPAYRGAAAAASAAAVGDSSVIESYSGMSASERVKMRSRVASKPFTSDPVSTSSAGKHNSSEVVEIFTDSDDELAIKKQKPRPKTQSKRSPPTTSSSNGPPMPNPNQRAPKGRTLPAPFALASSPLPPSDPFPLSTATTRYQPDYVDDDQSVPPIATLTAARDTSVDPDSSPSARKERPKPKLLMIKLKPLLRPPSPSSDHFDELDDGLDAGMMLPPPIPGASSTGEAPAGPPSGKPPKKSRKKQGAEEGEKPAKKPRAKKAKKDAEADEEGVQEKPKKKGKGKEKEKEVFKSAEFIDDEDDDEPMTPVDGALPPPLHSPMDVDVEVPAAGPSGNKPVSVISIPDSQPDEEELPPVVGEKRKRVDEEKDEGIATNNGKAKTTEKKSKKAKTATATADKTKKKGPAKKAKGRTVMSDDEDVGGGGGAMVVDPEPPASTTAPPPQTTVVSESEVGDEENAKPAKSKRAKKIVVSDSDGEGERREEIAKPAKKKKTKKAVVSESEGEGDDPFENKPNENSPPRPSSESQVENVVNKKPVSSSQKKNLEETPKPSISSRYTIAPRTKSTPMAELIRRVNSRPGSPFPVVNSRRSSLGGAAASTSASASNPGTPTTSYSPYHKFSRSALSRIAPLHPNRRTPPPPLPPPPPKPKTKKEKEREERWEEEMIEAVGGWDEWKNLSDQDQKAARRAKWAQELGGYED